ncbi:hypothetical protein GCK32_005530 [Trichostrongylus colubriformis]|uniref:Uncharacterized protein n=1 Tax=Trichostrongylus colubriformis TaxID=6319 RepID=A0AAN8I8Q2_TRICO
MACTFYREVPTFELRFACNFKGCLDDRPMSMMGAIEHQAFHFCEVYKTQVHFNFKCEFCNVYHVNKSHHRLCLDDKTGIGHLPYLRSIYPVPMSDQEFHSCVDFSRFANHHMIAVTAEGVRLVPSDRVSSLPSAPYNLDNSFPGNCTDENSTSIRKNSTVSYRDLDNCDDKSNSDRFGRSGGFQDKSQSGNRESRGRGRGGFRGRGERGFGRGRGRGGGNRDDDGGRENNFRGRGRGRGGSYRDDGNSSYRHRDSFGDHASNVESKPKRDRSYSRSGSGSPCSPAAKKANNGNSPRPRSYSRSRSSSPLPSAANNAHTGGNRHVSKPCSYSRSRSSSPLGAVTVKEEEDRKPRPPCSYSRSRSSSPIKPAARSRNAEARQDAARFKPRSYSRSRSNSPLASTVPRKTNESTKKRRDRSYSRSGSSSPPPVATSKNSITRNHRARSYSRSGSRSRSPPRNDVNNNDRAVPQEINAPLNAYNVEPDNYMSSGYGSSRQAMKGRNQNSFNNLKEQSNRGLRGVQNDARGTSKRKYDNMEDRDHPTTSRGVKRSAESTRRECSYSKSRSCSP